MSLREEYVEEFEKDIKDNSKMGKKISAKDFLGELYEKTFLSWHSEKLYESRSANKVLRTMLKASNEVNKQERQAKQELLEAYTCIVKDMESRIKYAKNEAMKRWWELEIKMHKQLIDKYQ